MTQPGQPSPWSDPTTVDPYAAQPVSPYAPQPAAQPYAAQPYAAQPYAAQPYAQPGATPYAPATGYEVPAAAQPYAAGYPPAGYPAYPYPVAAEPTNGLAIAALVVSIIGAVGLCFYGLGGYLGIVGAILGHVAGRQIRERGGQGAGMAKAGVIVGWIATAIAVVATAVIIGFIVWAANQPPSTFE